MKRLLVILYMLSVWNVFTIAGHNTITVLASSTDIIIDGYYDDWYDKPSDFMNNPKVKRKEQNLYTCNKISFYRDRDNIYVFITFAGNYRPGIKGENYVFWADNNRVSFDLTFIGGSTLTGNTESLADGNYSIEIRHGNSGLAGSVVTGSQAMITKNPNNINNQVEFAIPIPALVEQNPRIDINRIKKMDFRNTDLMDDTVSVTGTSTVPVIGIMLLIITFTSSNFIRQKKEKAA